MLLSGSAVSSRHYAGQPHPCRRTAPKVTLLRGSERLEWKTRRQPTSRRGSSSSLWTTCVCGPMTARWTVSKGDSCSEIFRSVGIAERARLTGCETAVWDLTTAAIRRDMCFHELGIKPPAEIHHLCHRDSYPAFVSLNKSRIKAIL